MSAPVSTYKRKDPHPSRSMARSDGIRRTCPWILDSITLHCDGNISCGLDDPHAMRSFGNIHEQPIEDIFANAEYLALRDKLWNGHFCRDCGLHRPMTEEEITAGPSQRLNAPSTLVIEPTVKCNIRCANEACFPNNAAGLQTRDAAMLDPAALDAVLDAYAATLRHVYFFNYGDPFVHPKAEAMLQQIRTRCPEAKIVTSTNGIPLAEEKRARAVAAASPDVIVFTISGFTQESYRRYHGRGSVTQALAGMVHVLDELRRLGDTRTQVVWRYLLFNWNDSDAEVEAARAFAIQHGVHEFSLYLTHVPMEGCSYRFAPGTPNFRKYREHIACALGFVEAAGISLPDESGLFAEENFGTLGPAQWTAPRATLTRTPVDGRITLHMATLAAQPSDVFVIAPWAAYKSRAHIGLWTALTMDVPEPYRGQPVPLTIGTPHHWWPAEYGSPDRRCLGVILASDPTELSEADRDFVAGLANSDHVAPLPDITGGGRMPFHSEKT